jgi:hypothetical protein
MQDLQEVAAGKLSCRCLFGHLLEVWAGGNLNIVIESAAILQPFEKCPVLFTDSANNRSQIGTVPA